MGMCGTESAVVYLSWKSNNAFHSEICPCVYFSALAVAITPFLTLSANHTSSGLAGSAREQATRHRPSGQRLRWRHREPARWPDSESWIAAACRARRSSSPASAR
eukprot:scaffold16479_cov127-Isochrysis_galbana.AAC.3